MNDIIMAYQQFDSVEEALAHYGVKGMKWGVTRSDPRGAPTRREIFDARDRVKARNKEYKGQRKAIRKGEDSKEAKKAAIADLKISTLADPDRMTAMRLTAGEKALVGLMVVTGHPMLVSMTAHRAYVGRQLTKAQREQARRDQSS